MNPEKLKSAVNSILPSLIALAFIGGLVYAWTEPGQSPPGGNLGAPLNTSNLGQYKEGGLLLNTGGAPNGLIVQNGNVGIGTTNPSATLDVSGSIQVGDDTSPCTAAKAGTLRWNSGSLQVCDGSSWSGVGGALPGTLGGVCKPDGTPVAPAASCFLTGYFDNRPGWYGWMVYSYEITSCTPGWDFVTVYRNGTGYGTGYCLKQ